MSNPLKIIAHTEWADGTKNLTPIFYLKESSDDLYLLAEAISRAFTDTECTTGGYEFNVSKLLDAKMDGSTINGLEVDRNVAAKIYEARQCVRAFQEAGGKVTVPKTIDKYPHQ